MKIIENKNYGFIYITTNNINNMKYIGKKKYNRGWNSYLGSGVYLKSAIKKYGKESFTRKIIEVVKFEKDINNREKYWIKFYNATSNKNFYNLALGGDGGNVIVGYSEERRNELKKLHSKRAKEYIPNCENNYNAKLSKKQFEEIIELLLNGSSCSDISTIYNVGRATISDIRNHRTWCNYTKDIIFPKVKKKVGMNAKPIIQYDRNGNFIKKYKSARECERQIGVGYKLISQVCNGSKPTAHGFIFKFV